MYSNDIDFIIFYYLLYSVFVYIIKTMTILKLFLECYF